MIDDERTARAALARLFEPQDAAALALVQAVGAQDALQIASGMLAAGPGLEQEITGILADSGSGSGWSGLSEALKRWAPRVPDLAPERDLATMHRLGGRLIIPTDDLWPRQLAGLSPHTRAWSISIFSVSASGRRSGARAVRWATPMPRGRSARSGSRFRWRWRLPRRRR